MKAYRSKSSFTQLGFSLIEIMVAVVIGMVGILVIMQVFLTYEGQKRTTTGAADAQESGLLALVTLERDLRMAGIGLVDLNCPQINAFNVNQNPQFFNFASWPAVVERDVPAAGSDTITVRYSTSGFGNIPTTLTTQMSDALATLNVKYGAGFRSAELVLISQPGKPCMLVQASQDGQQIGAGWNLQHDPGQATPFNPPGGHVDFPAGGYNVGARVTNLGAMVHRQYFVQNNRLMMQDMNAPVGPGNPLAIGDNIVAIRAEYGRDTDNDGLVDVFGLPAGGVPGSDTEVLAARVAVIARSGIQERDAVTASPLILWPNGTVANGGAMELNGDAVNFRYRVYQTIVPLRNVLWNG